MDLEKRYTDLANAEPTIDPFVVPLGRWAPCRVVVHEPVESQFAPFGASAAL